MLLNAAGYSDDLLYGISPRHPYSYEGLLSGEWAAAIYYDSIGTAPNAMWLTDHFITPDWTTNSDFQIFQEPNVWDDPCNPVKGIDTFYSVIRNDQVKIRIDCEIVDLGEQDPNGEGGSPLAFRDANDVSVFVYSERYVLLQTYTITNLSPNTINNLEFYQMLNGLISAHSVYETWFLSDPLEDYTPYNPVHETGNFHYDITQWSTPDVGDPNHGDWIGFSSTLEPDMFENGFHRGTDANIERRNLNGEPDSHGARVSAATGWYLGMLEPNESVSLTLAVMVGAGPVFRSPPCHIELTKVDDVNDCVGLGDEINYTISYSYLSDANCSDINDVNIIDYLPEEVEYRSSDPCGTYHSDNHTVTWNIGTLEPNESGSYMLKVRMKFPEPGSIIRNCCKLRSSDRVLRTAREHTSVCANYFIVDDFEGYGDIENRIFDVWTDFAVNNTGMTIGYFKTPYAERSIFHTGSQAMYLHYDNDGTVNEGTDYEEIGTLLYSEAERQWAVAQDWTRRNVSSLTLWFRGIQSNAPAQLYVAIQDSDGISSPAVKHSDPSSTTIATWTPWNIQLTSFTGVNLKAVKKLTIGVGDRANTQPGGSGDLYIDDIRLYQP